MHSTLPQIMLVSIQLLAIVLLQLPLFLPLAEKVFSFHPRGAVCYQDHGLCGCSADRISNKTCCCSRSAESSLMDADPVEEGGTDSCCHQGERPESRHALKMAPCGTASPLFMSSVHDCLYLPYAGKMSSPAYQVISFFAYPGNLKVRYTDPPDPPPKIVHSA